MPDKGLGELEALTRGEALLLDRRRRGETQVAAGRRWNVPHSRYSLWERDLADDAPTVKIDQVEPHERCLLYRRRAKFTQARVARELGVCRWWLNQMERGVVPCDDLIWYWEC